MPGNNGIKDQWGLMMVLKGSKRTGGPRTTEGKAKVAKNAIKHGLSATSLTDERQLIQVNQFIKELTDYYKPKSPLEKMYIERIAQTKAKLQKLLDVEAIGVGLAQVDLQHRPELILNRFTHINDSIKNIALNMLLGKGFKFPLGLDEKTLEAICLEVAEMPGALNSESEFERKLPQLSQFLRNVRPLGEEDEYELHSDDPLFLDNQLRLCVAKMNHDRDNSMAPIVGEDKLAKMERALLSVARQMTAKQMSAKPQKRSSESMPYQAIFLQDFESFRILLIEYRAALELVVRVRSIGEQMQRATILPDQEMEKMMRYQTTLERRLSSLTGEFLSIRNASN